MFIIKHECGDVHCYCSEYQTQEPDKQWRANWDQILASDGNYCIQQFLYNIIHLGWYTIKSISVISVSQNGVFALIPLSAHTTMQNPVMYKNSTICYRSSSREFSISAGCIVYNRLFIARFSSIKSKFNI